MNADRLPVSILVHKSSTPLDAAALLQESGLGGIYAMEVAWAPETNESGDWRITSIESRKTILRRRIITVEVQLMHLKNRLQSLRVKTCALLLPFRRIFREVKLHYSTTLSSCILRVELPDYMLAEGS